MKRPLLILILTAVAILSGCKGRNTSEETLTAEEYALADTCAHAEYYIERTPTQPSGREYDRSGFCYVQDVCPDAIQEIRYATSYNFTGRPLPGYSRSVALLSKPAAEALKAVSDELMEKGYRLKIFDAYRPQSAVDEFIRWARAADDTLMRQTFYPEYPKRRLFPEQFIASRSGHSRGSTVDLTLVDARTGKELDMGTPFDYMGKASYTALAAGEDAGGHAPLTEEQCRNRKILLEAMTRHGWRNYKREWWHYTLRHEPYPHTFFNFEVR